MKFNTLISFLTFFSCLGFGQDTLFFDKHNFESSVKNVFLAKDDIYVKTLEGLYKLQNDEWELVDRQFKKGYVFYEKDFFETDYIPIDFLFDPIGMSRLIPYETLYKTTCVRKNEKMFLAIAGALLEYRLYEHYSKSHKGESIRDIYYEEGFKVVSTYGGIFINDSLCPPGKAPGYSSGDFCKIGNRYFLCNDDLFEYKGNGAFEAISFQNESDAGFFRKLISLGNEVYSLNTQSINRVSNFKTLTTLHTGFEYFDLELMDNNLVFCTSTGEIFMFKDSVTRLIASVKTRARDLLVAGNQIYISTDEGLFIVNPNEKGSLKKIADLPYVVGIWIDKRGDIWISTEKGLFVKNKQNQSIIPVIPDVEFNRGAIAVFNNKLYFGSVEGLFTIDPNSLHKGFISQFLFKKNLRDKASEKRLIILFCSFLLLLTGFLIYYYKFRKMVIPVTQKEASIVSLSQVKQDIIDHDILSVEDMARYYKTNTVQLNRIFRTYETTPGKFLKHVKLQLAKELQKQGVPLIKIVEKTGYSAQFLKQNL